MYAIIKTGGKQYRVEKGDIIDVELLSSNDGEAVEFNEVLFVQNGDTPVVGKPVVQGFKVIGEMMGQVLGPKVVAFKYKRRKSCRIKKGHRQKYSRVRITDIAG